MKDWKIVPHQKWPENLPEYLAGKNVPLLNKSTPIASMGSCFAAYLSKYLVEHMFNYVQAEKSQFDLFSANWGIVVSPPCICQIMEYTFLDYHPSTSYFKLEDGKLSDPFRRGMLYNDPSDYNNKMSRHILASRSALSSCRVMVLTLGLTEVWRNCVNFETYARVPHKIDDHHEFVVLSVGEIVEDIMFAIQTQRNFNNFGEDMAVILTVSPIPLLATFRDDVDVVTANGYSKSALRVAVEGVVKNLDNVYYFPSYEIATMDKTPLLADNRHPSPETVKMIMETFIRMYYAD